MERAVGPELRCFSFLALAFLSPEQLGFGERKDGEQEKEQDLNFWLRPKL
jgi:hypothetical protein